MVLPLPRIFMVAAASLALFTVGCAPDQGELDTDEDAVEESDEALAPALLDAEEAAFITKINDYRVSKGKAKLRASVGLTRASNAHSADMAGTGVLAHDSSDGTDTFVRVKKYYDHNTFMAENIGVGMTTAEAAFQAWKASAPHNANMLSSDLTVIGISRVKDADGTYWWTTDFGGYKDALLSAGFGTIGANGGFESSSVTAGVSWSSVTALDKWNLFASSGGSCVRKTASAEAGAYGIRCADPDPGHASATQLVKAWPGVNYGVTARVRRISGASAQKVYLDFLDKDKKRIQANTVSTGTSTAWSTVTKDVTAPAGTRYLRVILYGGTGAGVKSTFDYDTVKVTAY